MRVQHSFIAALLSWGIALFEYLIQVPTNRVGASQMTEGGSALPAGRQGS